MKTLKKLAVIAVLLLSVNSLTAKEEVILTKAFIKTAIYCDHCKVCESCGGNFKTALSKIKGLKKYALDDKKMLITVYYNNKLTNINAIRTAISKMGFDADNIKAEPSAYEKLDGCCKKP